MDDATTATIERPATQDATTGDATGTNGGNGTEDKAYTKQQFQDAVARASNDAKTKLKSDPDLRDEIRKELEAEQAKDTQREQGQYKPLYEAAETELAGLRDQVKGITTLTEERDAALAVIAERNEVELKDAPEFVTEALAGKSAVEQFRYIQKHRDSWKQTRPLGNRESPRPAGDAFTIEQEREAAGLVKRETKAAL
jgi:hypothetical protein